MKKQNLFLVLLFIRATCFSQGIDKIWLLGYGCCQGPYNPMNLNFSSGSMVVSQVQRNMDFEETIGEISDSQNNLLFYSNGIYVANALDDTMQNGSDLNPSFFTTGYRTHGLTIPQGNLVIPVPEDSTMYYLFHGTIDDWATYASLHFYYSLIDMTLNNGLGAVTQKNMALINDSLVPGRIVACKHANGRDWWVFVHQFHSSNMYKFLITPSGIQGPWVDDLITWRDIGGGQALFSPQGDKFAYYEPYEDLDIWDFDRCSGTFSNLVHIDINDSAVAAGAAFSPSGRYLYLSSLKYIYQLDMQATNIDSSRITVGVYDGFRTNGLYASFYLMGLAPDNKIYINCANSTTVLHVINSPDSAGLACGFCQHCIPLPALNAFTMPNFPNYFLGADGSATCDTLATIVESIKKNTEDFSVFPNPTHNDLYLTVPSEKIITVFIYNSIGQQIPIEYELLKKEYLHLDVTQLESGFYFLEVKTNQQKVVRKFVRE